MIMNFDISSMVTQEGQVKEIPIASLRSYHNHIFELYTGERLDDMVDSIRKNGVIVPILVQPINDGEYYEILSGHNRTNAAKIAGFETVPAIIKEHLTEEEAKIYVVETNAMQRSFPDLKITEQAEVIKLRYSEMFTEEKRQAIAAELKALDGNSKTAMDITGKEYRLGKDSVARLLRVSELISQYADWVNSKKLSMRSAVDISYLSDEKQLMVYEMYSNEDGTMSEKIDMKLSKAIKELYKNNPDFTENDLIDLTDNKPSKPKPKTVKMPTDEFIKYFRDDMKQEEITDTITKALDEYYSAHNIPLYSVSDDNPF